MYIYIIQSNNPQRGLGGMKWGEYIGTPIGEKMLLLLRTQFCPRGSVWGVASDWGNYEFPLHTNIPDDVYKIVQDIEDVACHVSFQTMAKKHDLLDWSNYWDKNTETWKGMAYQYPEIMSIRPFMPPPNLYSLIPKC